MAAMQKQSDELLTEYYGFLTLAKWLDCLVLNQVYTIICSNAILL